MPIFTNLSGAWKDTLIHVRVSNTWKQAPQAYIRINGTWMPLYDFSWKLGSWSECSAACDGGTQTRQVTCVREYIGESNHGSDWMNVDDKFCTNAGLAKPATSQDCNTQACVTKECRYDTNNYWSYETTTFNSGGECIGYSVGMAYWDNVLVYADDGSSDSGTLDQNYMYSRSTLQLDEGDGRCPSQHGLKNTHLRKYTICREPI